MQQEQRTSSGVWRWRVGREGSDLMPDHHVREGRYERGVTTSLDIASPSRSARQAVDGVARDLGSLAWVPVRRIVRGSVGVGVNDLRDRQLAGVAERHRPREHDDEPEAAIILKKRPKAEE